MFVEKKVTDLNDSIDGIFLNIEGTCSKDINLLKESKLMKFQRVGLDLKVTNLYLRRTYEFYNLLKFNSEAYTNLYNRNIEQYNLMVEDAILTEAISREKCHLVDKVKRYFAYIFEKDIEDVLQYGIDGIKFRSYENEDVEVYVTKDINGIEFEFVETFCYKELKNNKTYFLKRIQQIKDFMTNEVLEKNLNNYFNILQDSLPLNLAKNTDTCPNGISNYYRNKNNVGLHTQLPFNIHTDNTILKMKVIEKGCTFHVNILETDLGSKSITYPFKSNLDLKKHLQHII